MTSRRSNPFLGQGSRPAEGTARARVREYLRSQLTALRSIGVDDAFLQEMSLLVRFLASEQPTTTERARKNNSSAQADLEVIASATNEELEVLIENAGTPRSILENIAVNVFGVPSGSVKSYKNREMLVKKLRGLIESRRAHESIARLASRERK